MTQNDNAMGVISRTVWVVLTATAVTGFYFMDGSWGTVADRLRSKFARPYTLEERLEKYGKPARERIQPYFSRALAAYPPQQLLFLGLKQERRLEVYAFQSGTWLFIRSYPILAASGKAGPKLREGDLQVPEGVYNIELLNPNSQFHLSLRVGYPNETDRRRAREDKRDRLGGDIMIHGSSVSVGCLAVGDTPIEELFIAAADTGLQNVKVVLSPVDFRRTDLPESSKQRLPAWTKELYDELKRELTALPKAGT